MRVLIADDDGVSRLLLARTLKKLGHEVVETRSGGEAWKVFQKHELPLVISDWVMPDMDGLELCRRIRGLDREKYTYVILLTALGGKSRYLEGMEAGADDFVTKPFDEDLLGTRIRVAERILSLQSEVRQLQGFLPICSYCKKIRDDQNYWKEVEVYVGQHSDARFSHAICPECFATIVKPQLDKLESTFKAVPAEGAGT